MELRTETELTQEIERLRAGFLLHDIGKVAMPDAILFKPGALTAEERALLARHPVVGAEIVDGIEFLSNVSHFTLLEAADGVEALEVAKRHSPAIVFLDVDMPRKDGIDTLRELRARRPVLDQAVQPAGAAAPRRPPRRGRTRMSVGGVLIRGARPA